MVKPILFNTDMVRAILEGRKTVTRRLINPKYKEDEGGFEVDTNRTAGERWVEKIDWDGASFENQRFVKPPYQRGDILYVREAWADGYDGYIYRADDKMGDKSVIKWHPSIHMPRKAARIWLRIVDIGVEQLQEMTVDDVHHEGVSIAQGFKDFISLWDSTVTDREKHSWNANPWVWVIAFERIYTWDNIYERAIDTACGDWRLKAKDAARWQVRNFALEHGEMDVEEAEVPEDAVEDYCKKYSIVFDTNGNIIGGKGYEYVC